MYFGKNIVIAKPEDIADEYRKLSEEDLHSAAVLEENGLYNQAGYYYFQSMEKKIKYHIAKRTNIVNDYFAESIRKTLGHSLNHSIDLLLDIYSGNDQTKRNQLKEMMDKHVFQNTNFSILNNKFRYPSYNKYHQNYTMIKLSLDDCQKVNDRQQRLDKDLIEMDLHY